MSSHIPHEIPVGRRVRYAAHTDGVTLRDHKLAALPGVLRQRLMT